jgi:hypothetical protein
MPPSAATQAKHDYSADSDELGEFLAARCQLEPPPRQRRPQRLQGLLRGGGDCDALSACRLRAMMTQHSGLTKKRSNIGNFYVGVRIV